MPASPEEELIGRILLDIEEVEHIVLQQSLTQNKYISKNISSEMTDPGAFWFSGGFYYLDIAIDIFIIPFNTSWISLYIKT